MSALAEAQIMSKKKATGHVHVSKKTAKTGVKREPTVKEMEKALGLDKVRPIALTPSDAADFREKGDPFKEWYEQELRRHYARKK